MLIETLLAITLRGMTSNSKDKARPACEALYSVQGLWCTSCALAVEAQLRRLPGIVAASVHYPSATLLVEGQPEALEEARLSAAVRRLGYRLGPPEAVGDAQTRLEDESRYLILRLLMAAAFGMWTMIASLLIYAGAMPSPRLELVMAWVSGAFALPVVTYVALPFYRAGWRTLRAWRPGMDALVSLGALTAVGVSLWLLSRGAAEVRYRGDADFAAAGRPPGGNPVSPSRAARVAGSVRTSRRSAALGAGRLAASLSGDGGGRGPGARRVR